MALTAVLLAGGKGTRLNPFTSSTPKPLLPLCDVPIISIVIRQLVASGFTRIVITLGYMAPLFRAVLGDDDRFGVPIEYLSEDTPLGTAGPLAAVPGLDRDFLVMNGDLLTTFDFRSLVNTHCASKVTWATVATIKRDVQVGYGVVSTNSEGEVQGYLEKPTESYLVSMGINMLSPRALRHIPSGQRFDMPELICAMCKRGNYVASFLTECYWRDIGRIEDYQRANEDFSANPERFLPKGVR
jgi:NDP-mannose synthase